MTRSTRNRVARPRRHVIDRRLDALEERRLLSTFQVIDTDDSGPGSLRQALLDAAASPGADTITFAIPANDPNHVYYKDDGIAGRVTNDGSHVAPTTATNDSLIPDIDPDWAHSWWTIPALAGLVVDSAVTIDGYSQPGSGRNTLSDNDDAVLRIELDGRIAGPFGGVYEVGLHASADDIVIQGLVINRFGYAGVRTTAAVAVQGCFVGTDPSATVPLPNGYVGVEFNAGTSRLGTDGDGFDDTGGGLDDYAERNVVSGNGVTGFRGPGVVAGNFIGTDRTGRVALPNGQLQAGLGVEAHPGSRIGVDGHHVNPGAERNIISGNTQTGVYADSGAVVAGNYIGLDATGTRPLANSNVGIICVGGAIVGTDGDGVADDFERNVISANTNLGAYITGQNNHIAGNYIGTNAEGSGAVGAQPIGLFIDGNGIHNHIGLDPADSSLYPAHKRNLIAGNTYVGVSINGGENTVAGNWIGLDATGTRGVAGSNIPIQIGGRANLIGTDCDGVNDVLERNIISGNQDGIQINGGNDNVIAGNYIGTDPTGTTIANLGNNGNNSAGVTFNYAGSDNTIGGSSAAARNIIAGSSYGIRFYAHGDPGNVASGNVVVGNYIGTDVTGRVALGNLLGIDLLSGTFNRIGGSAPGEGNVISGNSQVGVYIHWASSGNQVLGNWIGTDPTGARLSVGIDDQNRPGLGNENGVAMDDSASSNQIGGTAPGEGNTIAYNNGSVIVAGSGTGNAIRGNSIHDNNGLGIRLGGFVTNDPGDADTGPNGLQNYPVLTAAYAGTSTYVVATLNSNPGTNFILDFYSNPTPDPSGYGEGRTYLGSTTVTTDASGNASFTAMGLAPASIGQWISATATAPDGSSSEFSQDVQVTQALTTTCLTASANPSLLNQSVTFTATITTPVTGLGTPGGGVQFLIDGSNFGSLVPLSGDVATISTSTLSVGPHTIQASYSGDSLFLGSSASLAQAVQYQFSGFLAPLNQNLTFALNRTIPIRFTLSDFNNVAITGLGAVASLQIAAGTASSHGTPFNPASSDKAGLHLEGTTFALNWQTKSLAAGNYVILLKLADGTVQTRNLTLSAGGASAGLMADGSVNTGSTGTGALQGGDLALYVDNSSGRFSADELARIDDAVAAVNIVLASYGVTILETSDSSAADVIIDTSTTTAVGGFADGVLGCETPGSATIEITLVQGWNWYAGSDPTAVGPGQFDFETVVMHELGHALGLGHSADPTSVMYATLAAGATNRNLAVADLNVPDADGGAPAGLHVRLLGRVTSVRSPVVIDDGRRIEAQITAALGAIDQVLEVWTPTGDTASSIARPRSRTSRLLQNS